MKDEEGRRRDGKERQSEDEQRRGKGEGEARGWRMSKGGMRNKGERQMYH